MTQVKPPLGARLDGSSPLAKGLVGCWLFNEGGGIKVSDLSQNRNIGTLTNMANPSSGSSGWRPNCFGNGLAFDGTNDEIVLPSVGIPKIPPFSVSCWVRMSAAGSLWGWMKATSPSYGWYASCSAGGSVGLTSVNNDVYTTANTGNLITNASAWYHLVFAVSSATLRTVYVNAVNSGTDTTSSSPSSAQISTLRIGRWRSDVTSAGTFWNGGIDNFRIYSRNLSPNEISELYRNPYAGISFPTRRRTYKAPSRGGFFQFM